ncbi:MAG: PilZ domain-containing protein [Candidatus Electrothrix sp. ATG2]|nr:PilZ domain-containing protein [Candidatus Electrothrix sp. ATG2]
MKKNIENRLQPRMPLNGYTADIIQDGFVYTATVQDASLQGLQLQDLPGRFNVCKGEQFTIIVTNFLDSMHYKLTVHSQWRRKIGRSVVIGFRIVHAPAAWKQFINLSLPVNNFESPEEEVWDQYASAGF